MRNNKQHTMLTPQQQMISSGAGALVVSLCMTPLDVVKIRLQTQERHHSNNCSLYSNGLMDNTCLRTNGGPPVRAMHTQQEICNFNRPKHFSGTTDAFLKISRTEGISSLWSGLPPTLALTVPATVIYFTMYGQLKVSIENKRRAMSANQDILPSETPRWVNLSSGALARLLAVSIVNPLELVRTKMQSQKMPWSDVQKCLKELVKTQGVRGLWSGYTATLLRDVPFSAMYWPLYEQCKSTMNLYTSNRDAFFVNFCSGAFAGSVASTVTLPFDVIKSIKQSEIGEKGRSRGNVTIATVLVREQGARGLFAGLVPRLLKAAPACAILISSYEFCSAFFRQQNSERDYGHDQS